MDGFYDSTLLNTRDDEAAPLPRLKDVISWATEHSIISADEGALLLNIYVHGEGRESAAARLHTTPTTIRKRCSRARQKLTQAATQLDTSLAS